MKVYTKVVCRWQPDGTLVQVPDECESFDYQGPLALCGSTANNDKTLDHADPAGASLRGKNRTPPQPDYVGAANAQSAGSIGTAVANNLMSHPDVNTPLGSQTWKQTGSSKVNIPGLGEIDIPQYSQTVSMSPTEQKLYEGQAGISQNLTGQAANSLSQPMDFHSPQDVANKAYGTMTSRLDPQWQQNEQQQRTQLANQGLVPGGEAYDNAMRVFNQGKNDAYQQANLGAIATMPQTMQMAMQLRDQPLNEMNALKAGSQVNMPQFQPVQYPGQAQGPNTYGATQALGSWQQGLFNAQTAQQNAMKSGLFGLGAAGISAYGSSSAGSGAAAAAAL